MLKFLNEMMNEDLAHFPLATRQQDLEAMGLAAFKSNRNPREESSRTAQHADEGTGRPQALVHGDRDGQ